MLREEVPGNVNLFEAHCLDPQCFPFLLQSVAAHASSGRYDILFFAQGDVVSGAEAFARLNEGWSDRDGLSGEGDLPFAGGWFFLMDFEAARHIEPSLEAILNPLGYDRTDVRAFRCPAAMIHDRQLAVTSLVSESDPCLINHMKNVIQNIVNKRQKVKSRPLVSKLQEDAPETFLSGVDRIKDYLAAGDVFQVNLSRGWQATLRAGKSATDVYRQLSSANPAPFAGLAVLEERSVISSSPERLVQVQNDCVQTRPIAGTRPRGGRGEDAQLRAELMQSLKERAEHVMLIDLERNDLGRVCVPGSIEVSELMGLESYAHVHHIVSNVRGRLRTGVGHGDVLKAVFPGGTITGCPKVRAIEIIAELEGQARGAYTGSMGYLSRCGRMDGNILIRSLEITGDQLRFRAGAGIVSDSDRYAELAETRAKARGILLALGGFQS